MNIFQDPKRTGQAKIRKMVAKKKTNAYRKRRELQDMRELKRFQEKDEWETFSGNQKFCKGDHQRSKSHSKDLKKHF